MNKVIEHPSNRTHLESARDKVNSEIGRIRHAQIASLVHPNEKGARQYADRIFSVYNRNRSLSTRKDLTRLSVDFQDKSKYRCKTL